MLSSLFLITGSWHCDAIPRYFAMRTVSAVSCSSTAVTSLDDRFAMLNTGLPVRVSFFFQLHSTVILSKYIWYTLNTNDSVWLAQREGRAKNGDDTTNPAIIKMLYLSQRKGGLEFSDFINKLNIVPMVLSYEFDPCDRLKARELYRRDTNAVYKKRRDEDFISMVQGITNFKGRVHIAYGNVLKGEWKDYKDVADAIDAFIQTNYKLWPSNYIAYDILHSTDKYASKYDAKYKDFFLKRFHRLQDKVKIYAYKAYAKPVENAEKYQK